MKILKVITIFAFIGLSATQVWWGHTPKSFIKQEHSPNGHYSECIVRFENGPWLYLDFTRPGLDVLVETEDQEKPNPGDILALDLKSTFLQFEELPTLYTHDMLNLIQNASAPYVQTLIALNVLDSISGYEAAPFEHLKNVIQGILDRGEIAIYVFENTTPIHYHITINSVPLGSTELGSIHEILKKYDVIKINTWTLKRIDGQYHCEGMPTRMYPYDVRTFCETLHKFGNLLGIDLLRTANFTQYLNRISPRELPQELQTLLELRPAMVLVIGNIQRFHDGAPRALLMEELYRRISTGNRSQEGFFSSIEAIVDQIIQS